MRHIHTFDSFLNEAAAPGTVEYYENDRNDPWNLSLIKVSLTRKIEGDTAIYRIEKDGWLRRIGGIAPGHGLMVRDFKVSGGPRRVTPSWAIGLQNVVLPILVDYLPNGEENDTKENYERAEGYLILGSAKEPGSEMIQVLNPKDIEAYIKKRIKNYVP